MARTHNTVSFFSDLGLASEQVGVVKAIIRESAPHAVVLDITHGISSFDTRAAALSVARAVPYLNEGVVLVAVDPGSARERRMIAVEVAEGAGVFVGPDNGVLAHGVAIAGGAERAVVIDRNDLFIESPGVTFAARDVLAPVVAALCNGADLHDVGSPIDPSLLMPGVIPVPRDESDGLMCEVLWVDDFGNCELNVSLDDLEAVWGAGQSRVRITVGDTTRNVPVVETFADLAEMTLGMVTDSNGLLALTVNRGSAAREIELGESDQVWLRPGGDEPGVSVSVKLG